jgi:hypothetical protein
MPYLVSATRGPTAMASSASTAVKAIEWIRSRRAVGADHFNVVDERQQRIDERELADRAKQE